MIHFCQSGRLLPANGCVRRRKGDGPFIHFNQEASLKHLARRRRRVKMGHEMTRLPNQLGTLARLASRVLRPPGRGGGSKNTLVPISGPENLMEVTHSVYYKVLFDAKNVFGVARTVEKGGLFTLPYAGVVDGWQPFVLELREGEFADYLSSNLGCRLCSDRLKGILQNGASPDDELQWLPVEVHRGAEKRPYWILHFPNSPDVLNRNKSILAGDFVVKPVLSTDAIVSHQVFSFPKGGKLPLFVAGPVKRAIEAAGCTGMELSHAPVH